jgi:hypothetical protein
MESTREEAVAVLNRWKTNSSEIQVMLAADGIRLGFRGAVAKVSDTSVRLLGSNGAEAVLSFAGASFDWGDKREEPIVTRFESILTVFLLHLRFHACRIDQAANGIELTSGGTTFENIDELESNGHQAGQSEIPRGFGRSGGIRERKRCVFRHIGLRSSEACATDT